MASRSDIATINKLNPAIIWIANQIINSDKHDVTSLGQSRVGLDNFTQVMNVETSQVQDLNFRFQDIAPPITTRLLNTKSDSRDLYPIDSLSHFLARPVQIGHSSIPVDGWVFHPVPSIVIENSHLRNVIESFSAIRFDLEIDVIIHTNKLNFGELVLAWIPYPVNIYQPYHRSIFQLVQFPHILINLSETRRYNMHIPYLGQQDYLNVMTSDFTQYGALIMKPLVACNSSQGAVPQYTMYGRLTNVKFALPLPIPISILDRCKSIFVPGMDKLSNYFPIVSSDKTSPAATLSDINNIKTSSSTAPSRLERMYGWFRGNAILATPETYRFRTINKNLIRVQGYLYARPRLSPVTRAELDIAKYHLSVHNECKFKSQSMLSAAVEIGSVLSKLSPYNETATQAVKQIGMRVGWIAEEATKVLLGPNNLSTASDMTPTGPVDNLIRNRLSQNHLIATGAIPYSKGAGDTILIIPVSPTVVAATTLDTIPAAMSHPLMWASRMFKRWRGSLTFTFRIYGTIFASMQTHVYWTLVPDAASSTSHLIPRTTVDTHQTVEFKVDVPFMAIKRFLTVGMPNGFLKWVVETPLCYSHPTDVQGDSLLYTVWVSAGEDFQLEGPTTTSLLVRIPASGSTGAARAVTLPPYQSEYGSDLFDDTIAGVDMDYIKYKDIWYRIRFTSFKNKLILLPMDRYVSEISTWDPISLRWKPIDARIPQVFSNTEIRCILHYPNTNDYELSLLSTTESPPFKSWFDQTVAPVAADYKVWDRVNPIPNAPLGSPYLDYSVLVLESQLITFIYVLGKVSYVTGSILMSHPTSVYFVSGDSMPLVTGSGVIYIQTQDKSKAACTLNTDVASTRYGHLSIAKTALSTSLAWGNYLPPALTDTLPTVPTGYFGKHIPNGFDIISISTGYTHRRYIHSEGRFVVDDKPEMVHFIEANRFEIQATIYLQRLGRHVVVGAVVNKGYFYINDNGLYTLCVPFRASSAYDIYDNTTQYFTFNLVPWRGRYADLDNRASVLLQFNTTGLIHDVNQTVDTTSRLPALVVNDLNPDPQPPSGVAPLYFNKRALNQFGLLSYFRLAAPADGSQDKYDPPEHNYDNVMRNNQITYAGTAQATLESDMIAESAPIEEPVLSNPAPPMSSVALDAIMDITKMASLFYYGTPSVRSFFMPLGPISLDPKPKTYLEWIRMMYLFSSGSTVVKVSTEMPIMLSILPYSSGFSIPATLSPLPPQDIQNMSGDFFFRSLASTGSYMINPNVSPMEVVVPFLSDSLALFNVFANRFCDNNYPAIMMSSPSVDTQSPVSIYISAGEDFKLHQPIPPPPLVPNAWADMSVSEQVGYLYNPTERSVMDWFIGLFSSPIVTTRMALRSVYEYASVAFGTYNNFTIPGTTTTMTSAFYF